MFGTVIYGIVTAVVVFFFVRSLLIVIGVWKDPVLRAFEKYGDDETFFHPLPHMLGWTGALSIVANYWLDALSQSLLPLFFLGLVLLGLAYAAWRQPGLFGGHPGLMFNQPRWLADLIERTTRLERRRLAYMWLHLPPRLRLTYNGNDRAFREWADFVILSTLR
ncbi:MAG: hypothetical protein ACLFTK_02385 [Anaerolineales bacterium]